MEKNDNEIEVPDGLPEDFPELPGDNPYAELDKEQREKAEAYAKFRKACMDEKTGCFGNYCNIMEEFSRERYVKRCAKCSDSMACFGISQLRLMANFYKDQNRGDDWRQ